MKIPCKENKCLLYSVCQNKSHIDCPDIQNYYKRLRQAHDRVVAWKILKRTLKNMKEFKPVSNSTIHEEATIHPCNRAMRRKKNPPGTFSKLKRHEIRLLKETDSNNPCISEVLEILQD